MINQESVATRKLNTPFVKSVLKSKVGAKKQKDNNKNSEVVINEEDIDILEIPMMQEMKEKYE